MRANEPAQPQQSHQRTTGRDASGGPAGSTVELDLRGNSYDDPAEDRATISMREPDTTLDLVHRATHDRLTGLANRDLLRTELTRSLAVAEQMSGITAVLFVDLDRFKHVNDVFGHSTGDGVLVEVARRLVQVSRPDDLVARFGGDEFVVLCERLEGHHSAHSIAKRVIDAIGRPFSVEGRALSVGCSVGIAVTDGEDTDADGLINRADVAMYEAKSRPSHLALARIDATLRVKPPAARAMAVGTGVDLRYQPVADLTTRRLLALRTLIGQSTRRPGDPYSPRPTDNPQLAVDRLMSDLAHMAALGLDPSVRTILDLSASQVLDGQMSDALARAVRNRNGSGCPVVFAIDESFLRFVEPRVMHDLAGLDCGLAITSFGVTGLPLLRLVDFRAGVMFIDEAFVRLLATDRRARGLIRGLVEIADAHGMCTVASDVTRTEDLETLRDLGCEAASGPAVGPAMPARDVMDAIDAGTAVAAF